MQDGPYGGPGSQPALAGALEFAQIAYRGCEKCLVGVDELRWDVG